MGRELSGAGEAIGVVAGVEASAVGDRLVVAVRVAGVGVSAEMLPLVFDLFVQAPQPLDRSGGGLGLGPAIVRNLVLAQGGRVSARSEGEGGGAEMAAKPVDLGELGEVLADIAAAEGAET